MRSLPASVRMRPGPCHSDRSTSCHAAAPLRMSTASGRVGADPRVCPLLHRYPDRGSYRENAAGTRPSLRRTHPCPPQPPSPFCRRERGSLSPHGLTRVGFTPACPETPPKTPPSGFPACEVLPLPPPQKGRLPFPVREGQGSNSLSLQREGWGEGQGKGGWGDRSESGAATIESRQQSRQTYPSPTPLSGWGRTPLDCPLSAPILVGADLRVCPSSPSCSRRAPCLLIPGRVLGWGQGAHPATGRAGGGFRPDYSG
jgi:hypothetical protein